MADFWRIFEEHKHNETVSDRFEKIDANEAVIFSQFRRSILGVMKEHFDQSSDFDLAKRKNLFWLLFICTIMLIGLLIAITVLTVLFDKFKLYELISIIAGIVTTTIASLNIIVRYVFNKKDDVYLKSIVQVFDLTANNSDKMREHHHRHNT